MSDERVTAGTAGGVLAHSANFHPQYTATLSRPVIVLTYPHAGAESLTRLLSASRSLVCTSATGLLPMCHAAIGTWQSIEGKATPSPLAIKSVRTLAATMITVIQAGAGASRWCETAAAVPEAATSFLQVFPETTFLCLHRSLQGVFDEGTSAYPWGLAGSPFWPFSISHPGNNVATIAAYWAARTESLLEFECHHARSCLRVRYEDLTEQSTDIYTQLGLDSGDLTPLRQPRRRTADQPHEVDSDSVVPGSQIPPSLHAKVNDLHARLGYLSPA